MFPSTPLDGGDKGATSRDANAVDRGDIETGDDTQGDDAAREPSDAPSDSRSTDPGAADAAPATESAALFEEELPPGGGEQSPGHTESLPDDSESLPPPDSSDDMPAPLQSDATAAAGTTAATGALAAGVVLPPDWPDERGFIPPPPSPVRRPCCPNQGPVMTHTRIYHGNDSEFTEALASYYYFRDDARFGGWQNYLQRSDDFIRFCCHLHIAEMLSARGGAGETRVVWQWSDSR
jgi:hypothetical protein